MSLLSAPHEVGSSVVALMSASELVPTIAAFAMDSTCLMNTSCLVAVSVLMIVSCTLVSAAINVLVEQCRFEFSQSVMISFPIFTLHVVDGF